MMSPMNQPLNALAKKFSIPAPQPAAVNRHDCPCGCILEAHVEYKKKYKRNRPKARCPRCGHEFMFNNIPKAKSGAYMLVMKVLEEAEKDASNKTRI